jgi:hypothetical protein
MFSSRSSYIPKNLKTAKKIGKRYRTRNLHTIYILMVEYWSGRCIGTGMIMSPRNDFRFDDDKKMDYSKKRYITKQMLTSRNDFSSNKGFHCRRCT